MTVGVICVVSFFVGVGVTCAVLSAVDRFVDQQDAKGIGSF
jgi:hypothetical protein